MGAFSLELFLSYLGLWKIDLVSETQLKVGNLFKLSIVVSPLDNFQMKGTCNTFLTLHAD